MIGATTGVALARLDRMRGHLIAVVVLAGCAAQPALVPNDATDGGGSGKADGSGSGDTTGSYVRYEKFNTMATGSTPASAWASTGNVTVREVPFAADKSAELATPANLSTTFAPQRGRVVVEAKVLARETLGFKAIPYIYDADGNAVASVAFHDGNLEQHVGDATSIVMPFVANTWYRVRVVVDTDRDVFDLYVDGVRKSHGLALRTATDAVTRVAYFADSQPAGTLLVDNIKVYTEAPFIGAAPQPVFDPRDYGATGDGTTNDRAAIQQAIDAAAGTGGSVLLADGTFLSGTLTLKSKMTFFIASSAVLLGSTNVADYPAQAPGTGNTQLSNCKRALLYAPAREPAADRRWRRDRWPGRCVLRRGEHPADADLGRAGVERDGPESLSREGRGVEPGQHGVRPRDDRQRQSRER